MFIIDSVGLLFGAMFLSGLMPLIFSVVFIIAAILLAEYEHFGANYFVMLVYIVILAIFTSINPFMYIWHNPGNAVGFVVIYFFAGAILSIPKYRTVIKHVIDELKICKQDFIEVSGLHIKLTDEIPMELTNAWNTYKQNNMEYKDRQKLKEGLSPLDMSEYILNWIAFWPFLLVGMFIADPLQAIVTFIYNQLGSIYSRIYNRLISGINVADLK
jgi:hypothetical protein